MMPKVGKDDQIVLLDKDFLPTLDSLASREIRKSDLSEWIV